MTTKHVTPFRVLLDLSALDLDETLRDTLVAAILKLAPTSTLCLANKTLADEVTNLGVTHVAFKASRAVASASAKQAKLDATAADAARMVNNKSLNLIRTLTENGALKLADIVGMALVPDQGRPPAPAMVAPEQIDVASGKKGSGKSKATVHEVGPKRHYAAQGSTDGGVTWVPLPGTGKSRKLAGKSGTSMLVQFALTRGALQSPWSQSVTINFP